MAFENDNEDEDDENDDESYSNNDEYKLDLNNVKTNNNDNYLIEIDSDLYEYNSIYHVNVAHNEEMSTWKPKRFPIYYNVKFLLDFII